MNDTVEFYFEFASPYAYLSSEVIEALCARYGVALEWKPIMLGPILKRTGSRPLFVDGLRGAYAKMDCERWANRLGIPFRHWAEQPVHSLKAARGVLVLAGHAAPAEDMPGGLMASYIHACFRAHFVQGLDLADDDVLTGIVVELGLEPNEFLEAIAAPEIKQRLVDETEAAYRRGVFGAPTFFFREEMFWGNDRMEFLEARVRESLIRGQGAPDVPA